MIQLPRSTAKAAARMATVEVPPAGSVEVLGRPLTVTVTVIEPEISTAVVASIVTTRLLLTDEPGQAKVT